MANKDKAGSKPEAEQYLVVAGIENDKLGMRHEAGAVVALDPQVWDVNGFLACGAIIPYVGEVNGGGEN